MIESFIDTVIILSLLAGKSVSLGLLIVFIIVTLITAKYEAVSNNSQLMSIVQYDKRFFTLAFRESILIYRKINVEHFFAYGCMIDKICLVKERLYLFHLTIYYIYNYPSLYKLKLSTVKLLYNS